MALPVPGSSPGCRSSRGSGGGSNGSRARPWKVELHAEHGTSVVYVAPTGFRRVKLREGASVPEALARLGKDGRVALVSANVNVR